LKTFSHKNKAGYDDLYIFCAYHFIEIAVNCNAETGSKSSGRSLEKRRKTGRDSRDISLDKFSIEWEGTVDPGDDSRLESETNHSSNRTIGFLSHFVGVKA
jgi:hypothetical protein